MKGLDMASTVRMNHEGCTIINALRFLRSLGKSHGTEGQIQGTFPQPAPLPCVRALAGVTGPMWVPAAAALPVASEPPAAAAPFCLGAA